VGIIIQWLEDILQARVPEKAFRIRGGERESTAVDLPVRDVASMSYTVASRIYLSVPSRTATLRQIGWDSH